MIFIDLPDFPAEERAQIRKLLAEYRHSPAEFSIYAAVPKIDVQNLNARTLHVEHLPTKQKRAYLAASAQNWLYAFAKDLRGGCYTPGPHM